MPVPMYEHAPRDSLVAIELAGGDMGMVMPWLSVLCAAALLGLLYLCLQRRWVALICIYELINAHDLSF